MRCLAPPPANAPPTASRNATAIAAAIAGRALQDSAVYKRNVLNDPMWGR